MGTIARDIDELDAQGVLELVNELNIHADSFDSTVRYDGDIKQSSRFVVVSTLHPDKERVVKWYRQDGSAVAIDYVMIDEQANPRVTPGQPYTTIEEADHE